MTTTTDTTATPTAATAPTARRSHLPLIPSYIGAGLGFLAFLVLGAIPGTLYGGYIGLAMSSMLLGSAADPSWPARIITGGGMVLGLLAALFLFLVAGAVVGTLMGMPFAKVLRRAAEREVQPQAADASVQQH